MAEKPYPNPANLTEQLQNLCWRLAVEMRALYNTVKTKMTKAEADKAYLGKSAKAESAKTADSVDWSGIKNVPEDIGSGTLSRYFGAEALVDMYNGYYGTALNPKDYVSVPASGVLAALTAMHTQYYQGAANG